MKKKRYVYVLNSTVDYEGDQIIAVASSEKRAMELLPEVVTGDSVDLEKWDLDTNEMHSYATVWFRGRFGDAHYTGEKLKPADEQ